MQKVILIIFALIASHCTVAQTRSQSGSLSFENDKVVLAITVCDTISTKVIFDTGGRSQCFLPLDVVRRYDPNSPIDFEYKQITLNGEFRCAHLPAPAMCVAEQKIEMDYIKVPEEAQKLSMSGMGLLSPNYRNDRRIWCLNIDQGECIITERDTIPVGAHILPLVMNEQKSGIGVRLPLDLVSGTDTLRTHYTYLLDTGQPIGMLMLKPQTQMIDHLRSRSQTTNHHNYNRINESRMQFAIEQLLFFDNTLKSIVGEMVLGDSQQQILEQFAIPNAVGIIGWQFLKHFNIILDLKNLRLILTPCKKEIQLRATKPSRWGLNLNLNQRKVGRVVANGAASRAGLEPGDSLLSIQGRQAARITLEYIDTLRMLPPRTPIHIRVARAGAELEFRMQPDE